ncbi:MAG: hypothetical protein IKZ36_00770, partial [Kiritimatiellae bacterium]|nr:hypothetical protein [Kiritimatiellia bacterium]
MFVVLALLSVPILLIVILVKVIGLEHKLADLAQKFSVVQDIKKPAAKTQVSAPSEIPPQVVKPPAPSVQRQPKYEPTAIDLFWKRIGDWFAVRGDFAPKGMTHEFAFATRWLIRVGVVLVIGAIVYFVKLSIDRGWMGPTGRVASTLFWGMIGCIGGS